MSIAEVGRLAATQWKSLSPEKLQAFKEQADKIGQERKKQFDMLSGEKESLYAKQEAQRKIRKIRSDLSHVVS
jgi:uncharacterized protein YpuA (DUF1002 family)